MQVVELLGKGNRDTNSIGDISESAIVTRFLQLGYVVLIPYGGNQRYDLIIEDVDKQFWRIQCKTARIQDNGTVIAFDTANHNIVGKNKNWRHYQEECDYFAVYCEQLNKIYLIPVDQVGTTRANLRLMPTKNNQEKYVRWAKDFEL
jgi:PD-(D/E)XK endonuclease